jgi:hypothetical protein
MSGSGATDWDELRRYQQEHVQIFHIIATRTMDDRAWGTVKAMKR